LHTEGGDVDTAALRDLLSYEGPFASVYFDGSHDTEDADKELELRWRTIREQLVESGARERTVTALEDVVRAGSPPVGRAGRFLIGAGDAVPVDEYLPDPPPLPVVRVSELPYLVPLTTSRPPSVPHVVVIVDKIGAELRAVGGDGAVLAEVNVTGHDHPVHKVRGGGWSHRRMQQTVEETVKHNIARVAEQAAHLVRDTNARLLVLAGDVEPEAMLRRAIPPSCARIAAEIHTARPQDQAGREAFDAEVADLVAATWQQEQAELAEQFHAELSRDGGLAVQGLRATTAALREANVATLMIDGPDLGDRTVWTGSLPYLVAVEPADLDVFGVADRTRTRADEALPAAAIAVGADVMADGHRLDDGVGALLRHGS
jgi:hypothetical protein